MTYSLLRPGRTEHDEGCSKVKELASGTQYTASPAMEELRHNSDSSCGLRGDDRCCKLGFLTACYCSIVLLLLFRVSCVGPRYPDEHDVHQRFEYRQLTCKTIGLSIISSRPSSPFKPSAPRFDDAMIARICCARAISDSRTRFS